MIGYPDFTCSWTNIHMYIKKLYLIYMLKVKTILLGASCCGKSQIISNLRTKKVNMIYCPTIGVDFFRHNEDGVDFEIWDTSGAYRFSGVVNTFYRNVNLVILVYRTESDFQKIISYYEDVPNLVQKKEELRFVVFSIGQLPKLGREFAFENECYFFHFSALNYSQTKRTFSKLAVACKAEIANPNRVWFKPLEVINLEQDHEQSGECLKIPCI